ncbi:reverse transcriptase domain-containing protein [Microbulbifer taiwanensis]|nr:reverse transcriptase domain-containing protein [Microbulbifer taiwanensis]
MSRRSLEQAFNAVFHNKDSFAEFCSFQISDEIDEFLIKERKVYRTSDKFKGYLRFIDKVILRHLTHNSDVVHSYIREKSALTAVQAHAGKRAFFLSDIKSFFPNIKELDVRRVLERDKSQIPIADFDRYIDRFSQLTTWGGSLPVGFPTSPKLSNGFLFEFDNALQDYCAKHNLTYTRYSDDIIISGMAKDALTDLREQVQKYLHLHASPALCLNNEKTRVTHIGNKVKILGLVITPDGRVTIDTKYKRSIESLLHFYTTDKDKFNDLLDRSYSDKGRSLSDKERSLFGLLHYARSCDPVYIEKLQKKYGVLVVRTLMEDKWSDNR